MRHPLACAGFVLPCALVMVAACGSGESRWAGTMTDSAGVVIVSNTSVGMWLAGEEWTFEEELRIGVVEGDSNYQFGEMGGITVDSRGRIFVLDVMAQHIKTFSPAGVYEQTIGGPGRGPGELVAATKLLMGPSDTLLVPDLRGRRVNRYTPAGSSAGSFEMAIDKGAPLEFKATPSGIIAEQLRPQAMMFGQPGQGDSADAIVILATDGAVTDTLLRFASGLRMSRGPTGTVFRPYSPEAAWDLTPDLQLLFGVGDEYRIGIYSFAGRLERLITRPWLPRPFSDRDVEVVMNYLENRWLSGGATPEHFPQLRAMWDFGEFFPAFQSLMSGPNGTIWVQHPQPPSEMSQDDINSLDFPTDWTSPEWDVFDAEGRYLGVVAMPQRFTPRLIRGDKIYGVSLDEQNVPYAVRLRVVGAGR